MADPMPADRTPPVPLVPFPDRERQNRGIVARLWKPSYRVDLDPAQGRAVILRVIGLPNNLLGPWHAPGAPRRRAWMPMWYGPAVPTGPQPGERYDLLDLGLFRPPRWFASI